ncbi:MAG: chromosomal replication initiator protein DnaA [Leptospirales bacterium]
MSRHSTTDSYESEDESWGKPWHELYGKLESAVPVQFFDAFFKDLHPVEWSDNILVLASSDDKVISHLRNRYAKIITSFAREISSDHLEVDFQLEKTLPATGSERPVARKKKVDANQLNIFNSPEKERHSSGNEAVADQKIFINESYVFDRFVKGPSNEHAFAAAQGVAKNPMQYHNPLYLFGGVGLGKTHLLMAIANDIKKRYPWMKVEYIPSETFQNDLITATANNTLPHFKAKYRNVDILLIDDIQFISHRAEFTQETIFHTFNYLYQNNKQIVISGDRPPQQLSMLKDRLISRFQSGLIVDIKPPNMETRESILIKKASEQNLTIPKEVIKYIALNVKDQIRILEAVLIRLKFSFEYEKRKPDLASVKEVLGNIQGQAHVSIISVEDILRTVAKAFGVKTEDIYGKSRMEAIALARHVCMYVIRRFIPTMSLIQIAQALGRKDHTTVIHGEKRIRDKADKDESFRLTLKDIEEELKLH